MLVLDVSSVACKTAWYIAIADTTPPLSISPCTLLCIVLVSVVRACGTIERWCGAQYAHLCLEIYMCVCKRLWVFATATLLLWNARTGVCTVQPALHLCYYICTRHTYQSLAGWTLFYSAEQSFIPFDICHFYLYYVRCFVRYVIWVRGTYIIIIIIIIIVVLCQCEMACIVCDHVINLSTLAVVIAATFVLCSTQVQPFIYIVCCVLVPFLRCLRILFVYCSLLASACPQNELINRFRFCIVYLNFHLLIRLHCCDTCAWSSCPPEASLISWQQHMHLPIHWQWQCHTCKHTTTTKCVVHSHRSVIHSIKAKQRAFIHHCKQGLKASNIINNINNNKTDHTKKKWKTKLNQSSVSSEFRPNYDHVQLNWIGWQYFVNSNCWMDSLCVKPTSWFTSWHLSTVANIHICDFVTVICLGTTSTHPFVVEHEIILWHKQANAHSILPNKHKSYLWFFLIFVQSSSLILGRF